MTQKGAVRMDRTKVRIFLYVIDSGSLTKAAGAFGYTTSGISHMMSAMEEEVGFPLLIRSRTGVTPTANAERLIPILRSQLSWDEQLQQTISEISGMNSGSITIAAYSCIASQWLPKVISRFHRDYSAIEINLLEGTWQEVANYLSEHRADMGFYSYQPSIKYHWIPLRNDNMVVAVPPDHPLASRSSVLLSDLDNENIIMPAYGMDMDVPVYHAGELFRLRHGRAGSWSCNHQRAHYKGPRQPDEGPPAGSPAEHQSRRRLPLGYTADAGCCKVHRIRKNHYPGLLSFLNHLLSRRGFILRVSQLKNTICKLSKLGTFSWECP